MKILGEQKVVKSFFVPFRLAANKTPGAGSGSSGALILSCVGQEKEETNTSGRGDWGTRSNFFVTDKNKIFFGDNFPQFVLTELKMCFSNFGWFTGFFALFGIAGGGRLHGGRDHGMGKQKRVTAKDKKRGWRLCGTQTQSFIAGNEGRRPIKINFGFLLCLCFFLFFSQCRGSKKPVRWLMGLSDACCRRENKDYHGLRQGTKDC